MRIKEGNIHYVYIHRRLSDNIIFYVGKGSHGRNKRHSWRHGRSTHWQKIADEHGFYSKIIKDNLSQSDALQLEETIINRIGVDKLANQAYYNNSQAGHRHTEETRVKMSVSRPKDFSPMTGKQHTAETKAKISATKTGVKMGPYSKERAGKTASAMRAGKNSISEHQARAIRNLKKQGLTAQKIAESVGCKIWPVYDVLQGKTYKWVI